MTESQSKRLHNRRLLSWNSMYPAQQSDPAPDRQARVGFFRNRSARDAAGLSKRVMMRRPHFAFFITLIALGAVPLMGAAPGSISGVVRNTAGVPQIGAVVQLLRPDLSILTIVYTNDKGQFSIPSVIPRAEESVAGK